VARAAQQVALEVQRQRQLFASRFISQAALDQAEAQFGTATAQANAAGRRERRERKAVASL
jgi:multidrug resistance efflux pump